MTPMVGIGIYHDADVAESPELIDALLGITARMVGGTPFHYMHRMLLNSDRSTRQQKMDMRNLEQLKTDLRGRVLRAVQFDELRRSEQESSTGYASLHLDLKPARSPKAGSDEVARYPYRVYLLVPRPMVADAGVLRDGILQLAATLRSPYAFAYPGASFRDVLMELTCTPMFTWGQPLTPREAEREARLTRCQRQRVQLGTRVCGAYWGNLLGAELVAALGGSGSVKANAPAAQVEDAPRDGLFLQLTAALPEIDSPEYLTAVARMEEYLRPISVTSGATQVA
jgi:hypothetical protein